MEAANVSRGYWSAATLRQIADVMILSICLMCVNNVWWFANHFSLFRGRRRTWSLVCCYHFIAFIKPSFNNFLYVSLPSFLNFLSRSLPVVLKGPILNNTSKHFCFYFAHLGNFPEVEFLELEFEEFGSSSTFTDTSQSAEGARVPGCISSSGTLHKQNLY